MNKKNLPLILGIAVPLLMIAFVAISIYLPVFLTKPQYDFIYATENYYGSNASYYFVVESGKVMKKDNNFLSDNIRIKPITPVVEPKLYYYDVSQDKSTEIIIEKASEYNLDPNATSPDGFEIVYGNSTTGVVPFFYGNSDYNSRYIRGHNYAKKLNLNLSSREYYDNFMFLGWVK